MSNNKDFKVKNGIKPTVYHEAVGTVVSGGVGYNIAGASYDSVSFSVAGQDTFPTGMAFNNDGTKMYILGNAIDSVHQYTLSTAFDLSTASYDSVSFSVAGQDATPADITFNNDGTKMYMVGLSNDSLYQYSLSTDFDLSTASYDSVSLSVSGQDTSPSSIAFNNDGTKMYLTGSGNDSLYQYSLSTAFDLSTASYDSVSFSVNGQDNDPLDIAFNTDGTKVYIVGSGSDSVHQYSLSTAFDLSTASYDSVSFSVGGQDASPSGMAFNNDGSKIYMLGGSSDTVYQYSTVLNTQNLDLSTGNVFEIAPTSDIQVSLTNPAASGTSSGATLLLDGAEVLSAFWDISTSVYSQLFDVSSQEADAQGLFFKPDGTKMYIIGEGDDEVNEYNLSTAWDISTAVYSQNFSVSVKANNPRAIFFKPDGTKMYIPDASTELNEYNLSTAWDISTSVWSQDLEIGNEETAAQGLFFKPDGTKMYIAGHSSDVNEYNLSTAWDISTAVYSQLFDLSSQETRPRSIFFKYDGTKMYIAGQMGVDVNEYNLSTAWDVSTSVYSQNFSVAGQIFIPDGLFFKPDGTKMYIVGGGEVLEYDVGATNEGTITYHVSIQWPGGTAPTSPAIGDTDVITFNTTDGGTTYQAALAIDGAN
jgi:hypothetical protein